MTTTETFLLIWAVGMTILHGYAMSVRLTDAEHSLEALKLARETLEKWKRMIENTVEGKGKFVRGWDGKITYTANETKGEDDETTATKH